MVEFPHEIPPIGELARWDPEELDSLPFGILELDEHGVVTRVNAVEASRVGREPAEFIGRNFFEDIAPCTNVRDFAGVFREGARQGELSRTFTFEYPSARGFVDVVIHLASAYPGFGWVLATIGGTEHTP